MSGSSKFELLFVAETKQAKAATTDLRRDVENLGGGANAAATAIDKQTAALNREADAARKAADSASKLAEAETRAAAARANTGFTFETREQTEARLGIRSRQTPQISPVAAPQMPSAPHVPNKWADDLRARFVPLYEAQRDYTTELAKVSQAQRENILTAEEAAAAELRLKAAYDKKVEGIKRADPALRSLNDNYKLTAHEARNLSYQVNDVVQSLMLGMPVQQVLMQQGPQITQIYGGVGNTFKALTAQASPARLAIGGLAAAAIGGAVAWKSYLESAKEVSTAANGLGRANAGSMAEMEAAASNGAAAAGISIAAARSMEAQFLRTGTIGAEHFEKLIGLSKDFGATFGMETAAAGKALSDMFADPAKAAQTLYRQYGLIDAATAKQAMNLAQSNRVSEAQGVLLAALPGRLADATEATTAFARAWEHVKNASSGAFDWVGRTVDRAIYGPSLEERIADLQDKYDRFSKEADNSWLQRVVNGKGDLAQQTKAELDALKEQKRQRDAADAARQKQAQDIVLSRSALDAAEASPANSNALREQAMRNQISALTLGRNVSGIDDAQRGMIDTAIDAKSRALDALINRQQRAAELDRLDIQIANERNPLLRAELEARRTRLQLSEQEVSADMIAAEAGRARNRVIEETIATATAQAADMRQEAETRQRLNALVASGSISSADANRMLQEEAVLRPLVAAAATAEGAEKQRLNKAISDLKAGYADLAKLDKQEAGLSILRSGNDRMEMLRAEIALLGVSDAARTKSLALLEAEQQIRREGIPAQSEQANAIRAQAGAIAELGSQLERSRDAWNSFRSAGESAIGSVVDTLAKGDIKGALAGIAKAGADFLKDDIKKTFANDLTASCRGTLS